MEEEDLSVVTKICHYFAFPPPLLLKNNFRRSIPQNLKNFLTKKF